MCDFYPSSDETNRGQGLSPLYGKLSDLVGRKPVLFSSIFVFLFGSALCGAAQSFIWLAICVCVLLMFDLGRESKCYFWEVAACRALEVEALYR